MHVLRSLIFISCPVASAIHIPTPALTRLGGGGYLAFASATIISLIFLATMIVAALVLPEVTVGKIEASQIRRPSMPKTRLRLSTTDSAALAPILQVEVGWKTVLQRARKSASRSASDIG